MLYKKFFFSFLKFIVKRLPEIDPVIKLTPIMKLIGRFIVSLKIKLTLPFFELFCMPIINIKNKDKLNVKVKNNFLKSNDISKD